MQSVDVSLNLLFILSVCLAIHALGTLSCSLNPVLNTHIVSRKAVKQLLVLTTQIFPWLKKSLELYGKLYDLSGETVAVFRATRHP